MDKMKTIIDETDLKIGDAIEFNPENVDANGFIDACNEVISAAGMTAEEA
jgi:hypothetical protein